VIARPRLTAALNEAVRRPLTLVAAGPGSGKTVALSSWATSSGTPTAWLSLDPSDDDPRRLWPMIATALLAAGIVGETDSFATLPYDSGDTAQFVTALLDAVPGSAEVALVLDDAHLLTHPVVLRQLDGLIRYGSPRLHLVLCARSDPLLPLHRYRLGAQMAELRAADLAMTRPEALSVLARHGVMLRREELDMLTQRTEGWAAGLQLSAMRMAGSKNPGRFVTQLVLDQGSPGEYLLEEVLARQPEDVRRLLIQTSFLNEVSGPLAVAITEISNSAELLAELARTNSFLVPVEHDGMWYRCHQLLLEVLRHLLRREYPGKELEFQHRAAAWYEQQHDPAAAIRFAVAMRDWQHASQIVAHGGLATAFVGREDIVELGLPQVIDAADKQDLADGPAPEMALTQAAVAAVTGDLSLARDHLERARFAPLRPDEEATATLIEVMAAHQAGAIGELDRAAESLLGTDQARTTGGLRAAVLLTQASVRHWESNSHSEVEALLLDAIDEARHTAAPSLELECLGFLELAYASAGRVEHAKRCAAQSQMVLRQHPQLQRTTAHHLARAIGAHQRMERASAERALRRARQTMIADADPPCVLRSSSEPRPCRSPSAGSRMRISCCGPRPSFAGCCPVGSRSGAAH